MITERKVLIDALELLYENVPCCECCDSDDSFMGIREEIRANAREVGILVELVETDCYVPKHTPNGVAGCIHCDKYGTYKVSEVKSEPDICGKCGKYNTHPNTRDSSILCWCKVED